MVRVPARTGDRYVGLRLIAVKDTSPGYPLLHDPAMMRADATVVCDIIMKPARTPLLEAAAKEGLTTHPGAPMLSAQLPLYLEFFGL